MRKIIAVLAVIAVLSGCAGSAYRTAHSNANQVTNGMTVAEASKILGMSPTHREGEYVQWRQGSSIVYNATHYGAIEFHVVDGRIVDVPPGGIFSQAALDRFKVEQAARWAREARENQQQHELAVAEQAEKDRLAALARQETDRKAEEQRLKDDALREKESLAELDAAKKSPVTCRDKVTCGKVFALAQIYVQQHADQKIQVATDTIIETYNPTDEGKMAITVTKMPSAGTVEVVRIVPSCKEGGYHERSCRLRRTEIYRGFKPFIEKSLSM